MNDSIIKLASYFARFPGIGERQSKRFVYFLLSSSPDYVAELAQLVNSIKKSVRQCEKCFRFFQQEDERNLCPICNDPRRDKGMILIVEKDSDFESIQKSKLYTGFYFILGGLVPIVEKSTPRYVRIEELKKRIEKEKAAGTLKEIIIAFSLNPQGDNTDMFVRNTLRSVVENTDITLSSLGRGLSTGTELEYSDSDTIKNALKNRQ